MVMLAAGKIICAASLLPLSHCTDDKGLSRWKRPILDKTKNLWMLRARPRGNCVKVQGERRGRPMRQGIDQARREHHELHYRLLRALRDAKNSV